MPWTDEQIEDAAREFEAWADNLDPATAKMDRPAELRMIAILAAEAARIEARLTEQVAIARGRGRSWNRIAIALGESVSPEAAQKRFAGKVDG